MLAVTALRCLSKWVTSVNGLFRHLPNKLIAVERQTQELKVADLSKMIDNSLIDQLVRERFFESIFGASIRDEQQRKQAQRLGDNIRTVTVQPS